MGGSSNILTCCCNSIPYAWPEGVGLEWSIVRPVANWWGGPNHSPENGAYCLCASGGFSVEDVVHNIFYGNLWIAEQSVNYADDPEPCIGNKLFTTDWGSCDWGDPAMTEFAYPNGPYALFRATNIPTDKNFLLYVKVQVDGFLGQCSADPSAHFGPPPSSFAEIGEAYANVSINVGYNNITYVKSIYDFTYPNAPVSEPIPVQTLYLAGTNIGFDGMRTSSVDTVVNMSSILSTSCYRRAISQLNFIVQLFGYLNPI